MKRTSSIFSHSLCIHFRPLLGKVSKQFLYKYQYSCILILSVIWLGTIRLKYTVTVLRLIWEFRWYKQKANRRTKILFLLLTLLTIYPYMFQSDSFELEQFTTHYECFKKVSVQFLSTVTNWKGGTLDKSFFILELGKITVQVHPPTTAFPYYLV